MYIRRRKTKQQHNAIRVDHLYTQTNTNNVNKTRAVLMLVLVLPYIKSWSMPFGLIWIMTCMSRYSWREQVHKP